MSRCRQIRGLRGGTCGFDNKTIAYLSAFLACGRSSHAITVDCLGVYNEVGGIPDAAWILLLRKAMDAAGSQQATFEVY